MFFAKGIGDQDMVASLRSAIAEGDCNEIAALVRMSESERIPVDTFINATPRVMRPPRQVMRIDHDTNPQYGDDQFMVELQQVKDLAEMRDTPLTELSKKLPKGLREVSMFLADVEVPKYAEGKNYGTDKKSWSKIQKGDAFKKPAYDKMTTIVTGRDAAAYVHDDSPLAPWLRFVATLLEQNMPRNLPPSLTTSKYEGQSNFTVFGMPFYMGCLGRALELAGYVSFTTKWTEWKPRPEEAGPALDMGYVSQAYPEGSPMHCSFYAMHSFAALVLMYLLLEFFDGDATMESGDTVREEARLLADNIGMWRFHAGVHYLSDHTGGDSRAKALAEYLAQPYLKR